MSAHAHFWLRTLIIGSAIVGAFVLGAVFGHVKPWQKKGLSAEEENWMVMHIAKGAIPRVFARCEAASIAASSNDVDRINYVLACMRGEGYEYDDDRKFCDRRSFQYANLECYQPVRP